MSFVMEALGLLASIGGAARAFIGFVSFGVLGALVLYFIPPLAESWKEKKASSVSIQQSGQTNVGNIGVQNNFAVPATLAARTMSAEQVAILKSAISTRTEIRIAALLPGEPNAFAHVLAEALERAGGNVVPPEAETSNFVMNGQTGLLVHYNHADVGSRAVFQALQKARLNPTEMPDAPLLNFVLIKVGPI